MANLFMAKMFENVMFDKSFDLLYIFKSVVSRWYLYVLLVLVFVGLSLFAYLKKQPKRNNLSKTQRIAYVSVLTALSVAVNVIQIPFPFAQLSFVATVAFISGVLLGPVDGFIIAFAGDLLAGIIAPLGVYSPIIGIGTGLMAFVPGIAFAFFKGKAWIKCIICYAITFVITSVIINTLGLSLIYTYMSLAERLVLLPATLLFHCVNCILSISLFKVLKKSLPAGKFYI